jgi:hypothetical protein
MCVKTAQGYELEARKGNFNSFCVETHTTRESAASATESNVQCVGLSEDSGRPAVASCRCAGDGEDNNERSTAFWKEQKKVTESLDQDLRPSRCRACSTRLTWSSAACYRASSMRALRTDRMNQQNAKGKLKLFPRHVESACLVHCPSIMSYRRAHALLWMQQCMREC